MCKLEIKSMQVCESVLRRYERRILKIVSFDLNIRAEGRECIWQLYNHSYPTQCVLSLLYFFFHGLNYFHNMSYECRGNLLVAGNGGPGVDRCSQQGLGER